MAKTLFMSTSTIGLVGMALFAAGPASGQEFTAGPLVQVSDASPFGPLENCGNFPGTDPTTPDGLGRNFVNSEVEPWIDVNPVDPDNLVAFWQQDRWSNGGARSNVAGVSLDGGTTWDIVVVPGLTDCSGGPFERASDPWVSFAPDGTLHQISLVFDAEPGPGFPFGFGIGRNAMAVSKSVDGGLSWTDPIIVAEDTNPRFLNDKESITADPTDANFVYAVWDRLAAFGPFNFEGPAILARSTDGGNTWERAREIYDPGRNNQTLANQIVVRPDGTVIDFFNEIINVTRPREPAPASRFNLSLIFSFDKGRTWLPRDRAIRTNQIRSRGVVTPDEEISVRDGAILFDVAVNPVTGALYAVWQDARFTGFDQIAFSTSFDGVLWTVPVRINRTPPNAENALRQQAFLPSVAVTGNGAIGVTYYDFRNDDDFGELADHWFIHCAVACTDPANWASEIRLTDESFDYRQAPVARGLFLGDYVGLAADATDFLAFFQQAFPEPDPASGFFRRLSGPAMVAAATGR